MEVSWRSSRVEDLSLVLFSRFGSEGISVRVWTQKHGTFIIPKSLHLQFRGEKPYLVINDWKCLIHSIQKDIQWGKKPYEIRFLLATDQGPCTILFQSNLKKHLKPEAIRLHLIS